MTKDGVSEKEPSTISNVSKANRVACCSHQSRSTITIKRISTNPRTRIGRFERRFAIIDATIEKFDKYLIGVMNSINQTWKTQRKKILMDMMNRCGDDPIKNC